MSNESINPPFTPNNIHSPLFSYAGTNTIIKVNESLIQDKITYTDGKIVNIYTVYDIVFGSCINFGVDMNSLVDVDNMKRDILILGQGPTQE